MCRPAHDITTKYGLLLAFTVIVWFGVGCDAVAQERICADGKRAYLGVCPDQGNNSRPLPAPPVVAPELMPGQPVLPSDSHVFLATASGSIKTFQDLAIVGRAMRTIMVGTIKNHNTSESCLTQLGEKLGISLLPVPYRSSIEALSDLRGGHVDIAFLPRTILSSEVLKIHKVLGSCSST